MYDWYFLLIVKNFPGTVAASIADIDFVRRRQGIEELFEDGTASFLSIASVRHGFNIINSLTVSAIFRYTKLFDVTVCRLFKSWKIKDLYWSMHLLHFYTFILHHWSDRKYAFLQIVVYNIEFLHLYLSNSYSSLLLLFLLIYIFCSHIWYPRLWR